MRRMMLGNENDNAIIQRISILQLQTGVYGKKFRVKNPNPGVEPLAVCLVADDTVDMVPSNSALFQLPYVLTKNVWNRASTSKLNNGEWGQDADTVSSQNQYIRFIDDCVEFITPSYATIDFKYFLVWIYDCVETIIPEEF